MCLIAIAYRAHAAYPLLVAANRDEYYRRPTAPAAFWEESPQLLAGRDLEAGGTWMGITAGARFAAITNHRNPAGTPANPRSRGMLTRDFLLGDDSAGDYLRKLDGDGESYAGFNLLLSDANGLFYYSNVEREVRELPPGVYSLSNALLDSDWPKQRQAALALGAALDGGLDHESLRATVSDRATAADAELPGTGLDPAMERALSAQFIVTPEYGTRATTTLALHSDGRTEFTEQSFDAGGIAAGERHYVFKQNTAW